MPGADRLATRIVELSRTLTRTSPAPRGLAHLGLEHASGTRLDLLAGLAAHGIFRKYERVLAADGGLGGAARWLAARLGCEVVTTSADPGLARAVVILTRRTLTQDQVRSVSAATTALPFPAACFTHVWIVEPRAANPNTRPALAEIHRVLRPGGLLAVQDLCRTGGAPSLPGWELVDAADRARAVAAAGFVDIATRDVTEEATEHAPPLVAARARLRELARGRADDAALVDLVETRERVLHAIAAGTLRVIQLVARRP